MSAVIYRSRAGRDVSFVSIVSLLSIIAATAIIQHAVGEHPLEYFLGIWRTYSDSLVYVEWVLCDSFVEKNIVFFGMFC
jgi:hypothetical protein